MGRNKKNLFEQIPKKVEVIVEDSKDVILDNLKKRFRMKQEREFLKDQKKDLQGKIYNLSLEIAHIDEVNETLMLKSGLLK